VPEQISWFDRLPIAVSKNTKMGGYFIPTSADCEAEINISFLPSGAAPLVPAKKWLLVRQKVWANRAAYRYLML